MRTLKFLFVLLLLPLWCSAQKVAQPTVVLLGVDFSEVDIVGAKETPEQFQEAFYGINALIHTEPKKYNFAKCLKLNIESTDTSLAIDQASLNKDNHFEASNKEINIKDIISKYPTSAGNKLLIIAVELNKTKLKAHYVAVIFDGVSKEVITTIDMIGKPAGFGLRNFWAGGLYEGLRRVKY